MAVSTVPMRGVHAPGTGSAMRTPQPPASFSIQMPVRLLCVQCHPEVSCGPHRTVEGICYTCRTRGPCVICDREPSPPDEAR